MRPHPLIPQLFCTRGAIYTHLSDSEEGLHVFAVQLEHSSAVTQCQLRLALFDVTEREIEVDLLEAGPPQSLLLFVLQSNCLQLSYGLTEVSRVCGKE